MVWRERGAMLLDKIGPALENNRRQVFDVISGWIEQKIPAKA